jgi:hypothetical protein
MIRESIETLTELAAWGIFGGTLIIFLLSVIGIVQWH